VGSQLVTTILAPWTPLTPPAVLYTGGSRVGRIVATAAAKHLTPVTLEVWV
jgi:hypothetical protein